MLGRFTGLLSTRNSLVRVRMLELPTLYRVHAQSSCTCTARLSYAAHKVPLDLRGVRRPINYTANSLWWQSSHQICAMALRTPLCHKATTACHKSCSASTAQLLVGKSSHLRQATGLTSKAAGEHTAGAIAVAEEDVSTPAATQQQQRQVFAPRSRIRQIKVHSFLTLRMESVLWPFHLSVGTALAYSIACSN